MKMYTFLAEHMQSEFTPETALFAAAELINFAAVDLVQHISEQQLDKAKQLSIDHVMLLEENERVQTNLHPMECTLSRMYVSMAMAGTIGDLIAQKRRKLLSEDVFEELRLRGAKKKKLAKVGKKKPKARRKVKAQK